MTEATAVERMTVTYRRIDPMTGVVTATEVDAPIVARFSDHVVVELPDGTRLPISRTAAKG